MSATSDLFGRDRALVGMVHVPALPGTPRHAMSIDEIVARGVADATVLAECGYDAVIVENMHDVPYLRRTVGPEIVAAMTMAATAVATAVSIPVGVQVLAGDNRAALAVALAAGAGFIRAEGFVFASVADEGVLDEADAGPLLRYRRAIGAEHVRIVADIKKKHSSHALTADVDIAETARAAAFFGADGLVVTGTETGAPVSPPDLAAVRGATDLPLLVGSGTTADTVAALLATADAIIVGSASKVDGDWAKPVDRERARAIVTARG